MKEWQAAREHVSEMRKTDNVKAEQVNKEITEVSPVLSGAGMTIRGLVHRCVVLNRFGMTIRGLVHRGVVLNRFGMSIRGLVHRGVVLNRFGMSIRSLLYTTPRCSLE